MHLPPPPTNQRDLMSRRDMLKATAGPVVAVKSSTRKKDGGQLLYEPAPHAREILNPTEQGVSSCFLKPVATNAVPSAVRRGAGAENSSVKRKKRKTSSEEGSVTRAATTSTVSGTSAGVGALPPRGSVSTLERRKITKEAQVSAYRHV
jgi:hypothetical protein